MDVHRAAHSRGVVDRLRFRKNDFTSIEPLVGAISGVIVLIVDLWMHS